MTTFAPKWAFCVFMVLASVSWAQGDVDEGSKRLARDIFQQLTGSNSTDSSDVSVVVEALQKRLLEFGFSKRDLYIGGANPRQVNLVARLRGGSKKSPILFIEHFDVEGAPTANQSTAPRHLTEKDGYFVSQGSAETKAGDALLLTTMIRLKREGYKPDRDIVLAITADGAAEDDGVPNGFDWLLKNHRDLIDAAFIINASAGRFEMQSGRRVLIGVQTSEKLNQDFELSTTDERSPIALPTTGSAIYNLLDGLTRIEHYTFPFELNDTTRTYFEKISELPDGALAADMRGIMQTPANAYAVGRISKMPYYKALTHTTCVVTKLEASPSDGQLPQTAKAIVNCEILPGRTAEQVRRILVKVINDTDKKDEPEITVTPTSNREASPSSAVESDFMLPLQKVSGEMWPGVAVIPTMSIDSTDGAYSRMAGIPTYGVSGLWMETGDEAKGAEGRILQESYYDGIDFFYRFAKALTSTQ